MMKTHNSIQGRDLDWPVSDLGGFRVAVKPNVIIPNCRSSRHSTAASHHMAFSNPSSLLSSCSVHRLNPLLFTHRRQTITLSRWHIHRSRPRFLAGNAIAFFPLFFLFWITECPSQLTQTQLILEPEFNDRANPPVPLQPHKLQALVVFY